MARQFSSRLSNLEVRVQAFAPPDLPPQQAQMLALAEAVVGPEGATRLRALIGEDHWCPRYLLGILHAGAPDSEIERELTRYRDVSWQSPHPAALQIVVEWLASAHGRERWIDPYWLLRYDIDHGLCGHKQFCFDLATVAVWVWGTPEARASIPRPSPDPRCTRWDWDRSIRTYWEQQELDELWPCVATVVEALARARHPAVFAGGQTPTRDTDVIVSETLVTEHRRWLRWYNDTCPAIVPAPAPYLPLMAQRWAEELQEAQHAGLWGEGEEDTDPAGDEARTRSDPWVE